MANDNKNITKEIIDTGSESLGGIAGVGIGFLIAGPVGGVLGAVGTTIITRLFKSVGSDIRERFLSPRESNRIGTAYEFAKQKIEENESKGIPLRNDNFFESVNNNRPASEEVLEGIFLTSQREFEEIKIRYLGNLYANVCFNQDISKEHANQLIRTANVLSFRQFCLLQLLNERYIESQKLNFKIRKLDKLEISLIDIIAEIHDLQQKGLVFIPTTFDGGDNSSPIQLDKLSITTSGLFFCKTLSLESIEKEKLDKLNEITAIKE